MSDWNSHTRLCADERQWLVPGWWWRRTEPWRGRAPFPAVAVDHAAAQRVRELWYDATDGVRAVLEDSGSDPALAARGLAVLRSGVGEPIGSGVVAALLLRMLPPPDRGDLTDLLVDWHGYEFAAETVVRLSRVRVEGVSPSAGRVPDTARIRPHRGPADADTAAPVRRLRALLATAPAESYAGAVEILAGLRDERYARRLSGYLVPGEADWVADAVAELGGRDRHWTVPLLFTAVATPGQAARVAVAAGYAGLAADTRVLFSLAAHLGPASAAMVAATAARARDETFARAVRILACFPTDEAFGLLVELLPEPRAHAAMLGAVAAFPDRAHRMLTVAARRTDAVGADCAALLAEHLGSPVRGPEHFRPWLDLTALPALAPADALRLCALLAGPEHDYVDALLAGLGAAERAAFGWAVFERWRAAGHPSGEGWVWTALAKTADDAAVTRLGELIRAATDTAIIAPAIAAITAVGTETALAQLIRLAEALPPDAARAAAERGVTEIAARLGLTAHGLADRRVPTCGLDPDGALPLPDGTRMPLIAPEGRTSPDLRFLPRRALAPATAARVAEVERALDAVAAAQARRLERAMAEVRTWSGAEHRAVFLGHPILRQLARQLVWVVLDDAGAAVTAFRVTADGGLRDADDRALFPDAERVALAHPLHLGDRLPYWIGRFAEDRVRQPFAQLDRTVHRLTAAESRATALTRFADRMVATSALLRMEDSGWKRSAPADGGIQDHLFRPVGADLQVLIALDDGIDVTDPLLIPEQVLASVELTAGPPRYWMHRCGDTRFAALDPITASEVLRDLEILVT